MGIESLGRVERRVDINQFHVAHVLLGKLWNAGQRLKNITGFAMDE